MAIQTIGNTALLNIISSCKNLKHEIFNVGEILFAENESPKGIYIIEKGSVKLFKKKHTGEERIIYLAACGELLGLHPVVNNHPYASSAMAISRTKASLISYNDFMEIINSNNTYKLLVMKILCSRIDSMEEHFVGVNEKMTELRLAETLIMLVDKYGINSSKILNAHLSIDELASFTCTSKSYLKKIASDFSSKGLASISANNIKILNLPKIKNIVNQV